MSEGKIAKGALVMVNELACFTTENGGARPSPLSNWHNDERRQIEGWYKMTEEEQQDWRAENTRAIKAGEKDWHDSGGEPWLCPSEGTTYLKAGKIYQILRARCCPTIYYHKRPGCMLVLDTESGKRVYVKRGLMHLA
jgi:hypothetical protein